VPELRKLGTSLYAAISVAISRKGPWRLARTLATQTGMTNQWLKDPCLQQAGRASVCQRAVGEHSLPDYSPVTSVNRPVRTRMRGGVGAGGLKPPATQLCNYPLKLDGIYKHFVSDCLKLNIFGIAVIQDSSSLISIFSPSIQTVGSVKKESFLG